MLITDINIDKTIYKNGALILGNGKSISEYTQNKDYFHIGVNRIGLHLSPDMLFVTDIKKYFNKEIDKTFNIENSIADYYVTRNKSTFNFPKDKSYYWEVGTTKTLINLDKNNHLLDNAYDSPYTAIQLAYKLGFKNIDIIGVDYTDNHFYQKDGKHIQQDSFRAIDYYYTLLYKALSQRGVTMRNLSKESRLTAIPK